VQTQAEAPENPGFQTGQPTGRVFLTVMLSRKLADEICFSCKLLEHIHNTFEMKCSYQNKPKIKPKIKVGFTETSPIGTFLK
jgi:hypothetical protein